MATDAVDNQEANVQADTNVSKSTLDRLTDLGYVIHTEGEDCFGFLRQKADTTKGFEWKGQANYDEIGDIIKEYIQGEMKTKYGLKEVWIPEDDVLE